MRLTLITDRLDRWHVAQLRTAARRARIDLEIAAPRSFVQRRGKGPLPQEGTLLLTNPTMSQGQRTGLAERLRDTVVINRSILSRTVLATPARTIEEAAVRGRMRVARGPRGDTTAQHSLLCVGGRVVAAASRVGRKKTWAPSTLGELSTRGIPGAALRVATLFDLSIAMVRLDVDARGRLALRGVDPAPTWRDMVPHGARAVADEILSVCTDLIQRRTESWPVLVQRSYERALPTLARQAFHYVSRLWLWTRDDRYRPALDEMRASTLGRDDAAIASQMESILRQEAFGMTSPTPWKRARVPYFRRYPLLARANRLLFLSFYSEVLYNHDVRSLLRALLPDEQLLALRERLIGDPEATAALSTRAVNFLWLAQHHLGPAAVPRLEPRMFLERAASIDMTTTAGIWNKNYLLLHTIIGATRFYTLPIVEHHHVLTEALQCVEDAIRDHFFDVTLDQKFELLVCAELLGHTVPFRGLILQEAARSFANVGNFLVDSPRHPGATPDGDLWSSEHHNVLGVMATVPWCLSRQ